MVTKSPALRSGTSSATRRAPKFGGGAPVSRYALSNTGRVAKGSYGAIATAEFKTSIGGIMTEVPRGGFIPAEVVMGWPLRNRLAMGNSERVRYFVSEAEAREAFPELTPAPASA